MRPGQVHLDFNVSVTWKSHGKTENSSFSRDHIVSAAGMPDLAGSSAKEFKGSANRWNPEQLLLAALTQCHMMTFLYLAHQRGVNVLSYTDNSIGTVTRDSDGVGGSFTQIDLRPHTVVAVHDASAPELLEQIKEIHEKVPKHCFIARSLAVPVSVTPTLEILEEE